MLCNHKTTKCFECSGTNWNNETGQAILKARTRRHEAYVARRMQALAQHLASAKALIDSDRSRAEFILAEYFEDMEGNY